MQSAHQAKSGVVLDAKNLKKRYSNGVEAVHDVSLKLHRGEVLGLLGPNGAGKTTTVEMLTGFRERTGGTINILGYDPGDRFELERLRLRIGVVLQQTGHLRYLTVRETIEMHRAYYDNPRSLNEVLALVGLEAAQNQYVRQLSGGQQRRLDVAVALVGRPEVIFLDEPTTGFDPSARRQMWEVVKGLTELGTSVVLTTHYMEEASELADRLVVIKGGRVVGEGTPDELAKTLHIGTVIKCSLPKQIKTDDLPKSLRQGYKSSGSFELRIMDAIAATVGDLCQWSQVNNFDLQDLDVRTPSLEESYLALTESAAEETSHE